MDKDIQFLKGVGSVRAKAFSRLGINTVGDLLYFFPRGYEDRSVIKNIEDCVNGETVCLSITVSSAVSETRIRNKMSFYTVVITDDTGSMEAVWYNNKYIKNVFTIGSKYVLYGKVTLRGRKYRIENPLYEKVGQGKYTGKIIPLYPLSSGLVQKNVQSLMESALEYIGEMQEYIPEPILNEYKLKDINYCINNIHFPEDLWAYQRARERFIFEEFLILQLALFSQKGKNEANNGYVFENISGGDALKKNIPYKLTKAQKRTLNEIITDLKSGKQMNRLIQGDVGSGKTIIAAMSMYLAWKNGFQSVMMAPTEILATQHYESLKKLFDGLGINVVLLTGGISSQDRKIAMEIIRNGLADMVVGTHALITDNIEYHKLGLVVADEQHRFGVSQRSKLCAKGNNPHMLIMSATPIPRTLALILYGDLDVSVIDELPPGRKTVKTYAVDERMRKRVYDFVEKNVNEGHQAYVVCPLVNEVENSDLKSAEDFASQLKSKYPKLKIGLMHGKMKPKEKDLVMAGFAEGKIDVLVSTTVIEVGVNIPNSNIMIIENAERFGLSQLHQLRGRVGRGTEQAYCIMFAQGGGDVTRVRMKTMCQSNDGFYISEQDLKLRGPGDFFGTRQHGLPEMKIANLFHDRELLKLAQASAADIIENNLLNTEEYKPLKEKVTKLIKSAEILN